MEENKYIKDLRSLKDSINKVCFYNCHCTEFNDLDDEYWEIDITVTTGQEDCMYELFLPLGDYSRPDSVNKILSMESIENEYQPIDVEDFINLLSFCDECPEFTDMESPFYLEGSERAKEIINQIKRMLKK